MTFKLLSIFLCLCFTLPVFAGNGPSINDSIDELNYALTVEWDQQDEAFLKAAIATFKADLSSRGISNEELLSMVAKQNNMSEEELINLVKTSASYKKGASWNGVIYVLGGIGLGVGIFFTIVLLDSMDITG